MSCIASFNKKIEQNETGKGIAMSK